MEQEKFTTQRGTLKEEQEPTEQDVNPKEKKEVVKKQPNPAERFSSMVLDRLQEATGQLEQWSDYELTLAQNLYVYLSNQLVKLEADRADKKPDNAPIIWNNVDLYKLAFDCKKIVKSGLDAQMRNFIHVKPYFISTLKKYQLDLSPGYEGMDYVARETSLYPIHDIVHELVYEKDTFKALKKNANRGIESYEFEVTDPFNRGKIIGGFGYVSYEDETKNFIHVLTAADFEKAKNCAPTKKIWDAWTKEMKFKTIVRRTADRIPKDPKKQNKYDTLISMVDDNNLVAEAVEAVAEQADEALNKAKAVDIEFEDETSGAE